MTLARTERAALADLFDQLGPDRPTLCEGWNTSDLLSHLLVRERRPDAGLAGLLPPLAGWSRRVRAGYSNRLWHDEVQMFRDGPSRWSPLSLEPVDAAINGMELFVHHEDVRRGEPGWEPRDLDGVSAAAVGKLAGSFLVRRAARRAGVGVTARFRDGTEQVIRSGSPMAVLHGDPGEVVLWASGRSAVRLQIEGDPAAAAALQAANRKL